MHINRVITQNFKGQDTDRRFGPVTAIVGDNFAGKTTLADAIRFALAGYLPGIGKTAPLIWDAVAGNPELPGTVEAQVSFDSGRTSKVSLSRNKKGAVSLEGTPPADLCLDPMLLDVRCFFRLTKEQRAATIFAASGAMTLEADELAKELWKIEASPVSHRDTIVRGLIDETKNGFAKEPIRQKACEILAALWKDTLKERKATHKVQAGAFAGMKLPESMPQKPDGLTEALADRDALLGLRGELKTLLRDSQREAQLDVALKAAVEKREELRKQLESLPDLEDPPIQPTLLIEFEAAKPEIESLKERITFLRGEIERTNSEIERARGVDICPCCGLKGGMEKVRENLNLRIAELTESNMDATAKLDAISEQFFDVPSTAAQFSAALAEHEQTAESYRKLADDIDAACSGIESMKSELERIRGDRTERIEQLNRELARLPLVESRIEELTRMQTEFDGYRKLIVDRERKEREVLNLACEIEVLDGAVKAMTRIIESKSSEAFGEVLKLSRSFTAGLINSDLEFSDGELGRRVSEADIAQGRKAQVGSWIPWTSFSGTEELLAMAGFSVALARLAPFKLVILDELGRLAKRRRIEVLERMNELVANRVVDQVILIDADQDGDQYRRENVTMVAR